MKITAIRITDYKRVRDVVITPDVDRALVLIGGKNGAGKSSTLDALTAAFGGANALASDPVRHGADEARIFVELDGGTFTIDRKIAADGKTVLEVRDADGAIRAPQAMLDKLVGSRFLDPLAFLSLAAKDQRATLMRLIPGADRIAGLNEKRARAFDRRTEIGRELTRAEGELARLPEVLVDAPIEAAALNAEVKALAERQRAGDALGAVRDAKARKARAADAEHERNTQAITALEQQIAELQRQLSTLQARDSALATAAELAELEANEAAAAADEAGAAWVATLPRRQQLDADLARADAHNRAVFGAEAQMKRRAEASAAVDKLKGDSKELTKALTTIDERKAEILAGATLPVDGLSIGDDGIELAGVPFAQASDAERWRVALELAIAASPELDDVWVRDGALLDDESLQLVAQQATAAGKRVWIERVGVRDEGVIVIQDGKVGR